jgi:hypothetical protein
MKDSVRINNWFTFVSIIIISATIVVYTKYVNPNTTKRVLNSGLPCQNISTPLGKIICFDRVYNKHLLKQSLKFFNDGYYDIQGKIIPSVYMKSKIYKYLSIKKLDLFFLNSIKIPKKQDGVRVLKIKYQVLENDILDPHKKSKSKNCNFSG